jgi:hypothetical protein
MARQPVKGQEGKTASPMPARLRGEERRRLLHLPGGSNQSHAPRTAVSAARPLRAVRRRRRHLDLAAASRDMSSPPRSPITSSRITATGIASCWARCRACVGTVMLANGLPTRRPASLRSDTVARLGRTSGRSIRGIRPTGESRPVTETDGAEGLVPLLPPSRRILPRRIS